jgi:hypothetical protein
MIYKKFRYWNIFNIILFVCVTTCNIIFFDNILFIIEKNYTLFLLYNAIILYNLILLFSLFLYKIKYSPFGQLKKTEFPRNSKIIHEYKLLGRIGLFPVDNLLSKWILFEEGLGLKLFGFIKIFVPKENFIKISGKKIEHCLPEIYNPIMVNETIINQLINLKGT